MQGERLASAADIKAARRELENLGMNLKTNADDLIGGGTMRLFHGAKQEL